MHHICLEVCPVPCAPSLQRPLQQANLPSPPHCQVDDINAAMEDLVKHNIRSLDKKPKVGATSASFRAVHCCSPCADALHLSLHPQIGAHGKPVIFLHPKVCALTCRGYYLDICILG